MTRTKRCTLTFKRPFTLKGIARELPGGNYELVTDEELIEGLSFSAYRRVSSWIMTPADGFITATEMIAVDPDELVAAQERDRAFEG